MSAQLAQKKGFGLFDPGLLDSFIHKVLKGGEELTEIKRFLCCHDTFSSMDALCPSLHINARSNHFLPLFLGVLLPLALASRPILLTIHIEERSLTPLLVISRQNTLVKEQEGGYDEHAW